jgi:hypothetical protein
MKKIRLIVAMLAIASSCQPPETTANEKPSKVAVKASNTTRFEYECHQTQSQSAATVWPIPKDATRLPDDVFTKRIKQGTGTKRARDATDTVILCITNYELDGRVLSHVPYVIHDLQGEPKEWAQVIGMMVEGEVRRAWISPRRKLKRFSVIDFELQPFPIIR